MPTEVPVVVPHESVNDETVRLIRWLVEDGQRVNAGDPVAEVEGSKSTFEVPCEHAGVVRRLAAVGDEVPVGAPLCRVLVTGEDEKLLPSANGVLPPPVAAPHPPPEPRPVHASAPVAILPAEKAEALAAPRSQRFSAAAQQLIRQHNLDPALFGELSLVRAADVRARLDPHAPAPTPLPAAVPESRPEPPPARRPAGGPATDPVPLSRQKLTEIRYLRQGAANVIPSRVSALVPTAGLREALLRDQAALSLTALIVFESARLLRRYPNFNAFYADQAAHRYRDVNVGFAVAGEFGLKVPVVRNADRLTAGRISEEVRTLLAAYAADSLAPEQLAGGTFTVSDLSGEGVFALDPLIVQGQSAILGVGAETGAGGERAFTLTLSFDHQLADGREAGQFLGELVTRLRHHEATLRRRAHPPTCARCNRTLGEIQRLKGHLLQTLSESGGVVPVCSSCIAGF